MAITAAYILNTSSCLLQFLFYLLDAQRLVYLEKVAGIILLKGCRNELHFKNRPVVAGTISRIAPDSYYA